ncbi:MAG: hypothetical protein U0Z44_19235 [Kouleothrix sp.]
MYVSPQEYQPAIDRNSAQLPVNDKREIGPYTITFLGFDAAESHGGNSGDIGAQLKVTYQGQDTVVSPIIRLVANETDPAKALQHLPADLPGGKTVVSTTSTRCSAGFLCASPMDLPVEPAKAVIMVSVKPGILLVGWVIIGVLGGLIALVRRTPEGRWRPAGRACACRAAWPTCCAAPDHRFSITAFISGRYDNQLRSLRDPASPS